MVQVFFFLLWARKCRLGILQNRCFEDIRQIYRRTPIPKCDFNKFAQQLYWNYTSIWVLSCKFAAYFQTTFFYKNTFGGNTSVYSYCTLYLAHKKDINPYTAQKMRFSDKDFFNKCDCRFAHINSRNP